jgi:hypothetical protein
MANTITNPADASVGATGGLFTSPETYISLGDLIDPTKPDVQDLYVATYGDQGITGFLDLTGAKKNAGTADKVEWYEEGRLHKTLIYTELTSAEPGVLSCDNNPNGENVRLNDVLLLHDGQRVVVVDIDAATGSVKVASLKGGSTTAIASGSFTAAIVGNIYAQGTDQPTAFYQTGLKKRENPYIITKEMYEVAGSQATNIGWLNVNGQYLWYLKNEMDARKRFMNQREMMLLYSQGVTTAGDSIGMVDAQGTSITGSEGYFEAVESRGITAQVSGGAQGSFASMSDIDTIILELDKRRSSC